MRGKPPSPILVVVLALAPRPTTAGDRLDGNAYATRSVVHARHGVAATAHPLASEIAIGVLRSGGNAIDAAIAANAALGVLEPVSCGIGGDLFALVWIDADARLYGLNASGRAPARSTIERVPAESDGTIPLFSPHAWTVPGAADGWFELHRRFGHLPMAEILAPAIRAAEEGEPVPQVIAQAWERGERRFGGKPGFNETFLPGGRAPREGEVFKNPALARAYRALAESGREAFYGGPIARSIVALSEKQGGAFTLEDFASHRSEWVEPLSTDYRGVAVYELPPNTQGLAALQILNILERFDLKKMGRDSVDFWHTLIEAKKLVFEDRARFYADPLLADVPIEGLLSKSYAAKRAALISPKHAAREIPAGDPRLALGDTTYLAVADEHGNMVSLIQSNYTGFGSGYVVADWGFGLQNRGALFNLDPAHPNALAPGKRPFHTIIPAFAMRDGKPWLAFGVMGGDMQPQGHVQVLVNLIDFGMNLQEAGDAPRFYHTDSSEPTGTKMTAGGKLSLEHGVPERVRRALARRGHRLVDPQFGAFGGYQAVARDPVTGVLSAASESRKDGCALGY